MKQETTYAVTVSVVGVISGQKGIDRHGEVFGRLGRIASGMRLFRQSFMLWWKSLQRLGGINLNAKF